MTLLWITYLNVTSFSVTLIGGSVSGSGEVVVSGASYVVLISSVVLEVLGLGLPLRGNFPPQGDGRRRGIPMLA